jgi:hypothetical protein
MVLELQPGDALRHDINAVRPLGWNVDGIVDM